MHLDDRRHELAEAMDTQGLWPADSPWVRRAILDSLPRHQFAPDRLWTWNGHDAYEPVDRAHDQNAWADLVYIGPEDSTIIQVVDGLPSSSLSCTAVVADMLDSLLLEPGQRVLEVGSGAGWNAALLASRAGAGLVTTVEVDVELAAAAARRLAVAGLDVAVHTGDGNAGWPAAAPFDRLIATYAVERIPWTWIEQTAPGGRLVIPWGRMGHVALTVADDGKSATGWVQGLGLFMPSRGVDQGLAFHTIRGDVPGRAVQVDVDRDLRRLADAHLLFALRVSHPDIRIATSAAEADFFVHLHDGVSSWAHAVIGEGGTTTVYEGGPRHLLAEVYTGWECWEAADTPPVWDFGMTVTPDGQAVWAGTEGNGPYAG
ncbi:methyltransferase domain-containing protein [Streptomyces erythrochromogenes]|uniref:methyltransferase domain-containing protein n=1 Tax=Streptomyces erythrochromogenes TaxID=285574 RepID=UPI00386A0410|nr:methyltransferase domain-containing protein [Streptomyces erythrochromogenes]WSR88303.1 methyltransferase domain-containing protein [Streptomyces erythrochromogenes]